MSSVSLDKRIEAKEATYGLHIECSKTFYREMRKFKPRNGVATVAIPTANLNGYFELNVVINATKEIRNYRVKNSHEDYGRKTFFVSVGDFLAIAEGHNFDADIHQDMLESLDSIMQIQQRSDNSTDMGVIFEGPKIAILLPKADWRVYSEIRSNRTFQSIQITSVVLPVLMEALSLIATGNPDYADYRWYRNLVLRLHQKQLEAEGSPLENAQHLLEMPINRTLETFRNHILEDDIDD